MRTFSRCGLALILLTGGGCGKKEWQEFTPEDGSFTVAFPAKPQEEYKIQRVFVIHTYSARAWKTGYLVITTDLTSKAKDRFDFDVAIEEVAKHQNATVVSKKEIELGGNKGREVEFEIPEKKGYGLARVYLVGDRLYKLAVATYGSKPDPEDVRKFFDSFRLHK